MGGRDNRLLVALGSALQELNEEDYLLSESRVA